MLMEVLQIAIEELLVIITIPIRVSGVYFQLFMWAVWVWFSKYVGIVS